MLTGGSCEFVMNIGKREVRVFRDGLGKPQMRLRKGGGCVVCSEISMFAEGNETMSVVSTIICILYSSSLTIFVLQKL